MGFCTPRRTIMDFKKKKKKKKKIYQRDPPKHDGEKEQPGPHCPIGFYLQKFMNAEQNYPIHDQEFLAIIWGLCAWLHLLKGTEIPVLVFTDHTNLWYYRDARKIGLCIAGYLPEHEQYNILLEYKPGATNHADVLSRWPDYDTGNIANEDVVIWPDKYFCKEHTIIWVFNEDSI